MERMTISGKCPICGKDPLVLLPIGYKMFVEKPDCKQPVSGLLAFRCSEEGHIFFVMVKDVQENIEF